MKFTVKVLAASLALAGSTVAFAQKGETVKIAHIDPFSGPFANVGQNQLKSWQFVAERLNGANNPAGVKFEITGFDNKGSPQESLNALKAAIDQGYRYVTQGNGSGAAAAITDAVSKHNERNPGKEVVLRGSGPSVDQRKVQLLAFPAGCRHLNEDGSLDQLHEG